ncbi:MAG: aspartate carbamoyltransferase [Verrucomicrobia bacterium]|nr:aspartate carbamoyltransferase [Verrucomicrobiota bacterium]MDA1086259.1 aspartate carbamoyltransferase [Verrucomicrobiota bacterium]
MNDNSVGLSIEPRAELVNRCNLAGIEWHELQDLSNEQRAPYFNNERGEDHVLLAQQFGRERLDRIGQLGTAIRQIAKSRDGAIFLKELLSTKRAMLYFTQPSSRTFLSFRSACQILGIESSEVRDTATSSEVKGESQEDSVRTFSSYCDVMIMRTHVPGFSERMAWVLAHSDRPIPVLNAGSGKDQHPSQAVLDIYTLQRSFEKQGGIDGKRIVFVGDLLRGRTVRSLARLLMTYDDVKMVFVAPDELQIGEDIQAMLSDAGVAFELSADFEPHISTADAIYMTRVQDEWDASEGRSTPIDVSKFHFEIRHLDVMRPDAVLMHPFPRREEIPIEVDHDRRAVYWRQMRNGMWIRAALIASIFGHADSIFDFAEDRESS